MSLTDIYGAVQTEGHGAAHVVATLRGEAPQPAPVAGPQCVQQVERAHVQDALIVAYSRRCLNIPCCYSFPYVEACEGVDCVYVRAVGADVHDVVVLVHSRGGI